MLSWRLSENDNNNNNKYDDVYEQQDIDVASIENRVGVRVVDDLEDVEEFISAVSMWNDTQMVQTEASRGKSSYVGDDNDDVSSRFIGIDCEWKPNFLLEGGSDEPQPVLLLPIALHPLLQVYLLDLQTLLRPLRETTEALNNVEKAVSRAMELVLSSKYLIKVWFHLNHDLRRLASIYPYIPTFWVVHSVLEVSLLAERAVLQLAGLLFLEILQRSNIAHNRKMLFRGELQRCYLEEDSKTKKV
jgi:hypothetical protein